MPSKQIAMTMPESMYSELESLCVEYRVEDRVTFNSVPMFVRALIFAHLRRLRGYTYEEETRFANLDLSKFGLRRCPNCHFETRLNGLPVLLRSGTKLQCTVCGSKFEETEVTERCDW